MTDSAASDDDVKFYDPATNAYNLALDPRCLWGWGPGDGRTKDCVHEMFGHACFRPLGHAGKCRDGGDHIRADDPSCYRSQRPKDWDEKGRAEANK